jgi:2C-methyl-D-erythritol 2,4-cyclodiphosphate synthase
MTYGELMRTDEQCHILGITLMTLFSHNFAIIQTTSHVLLQCPLINDMRENLSTILKKSHHSIPVLLTSPESLTIVVFIFMDIQTFCTLLIC